MLNSIGVKFIFELFDDIFIDILLKRNLNIVESEVEMILFRRLNCFVVKNIIKEIYVIFLGVGVYDYYILVVVDVMILRFEFYIVYIFY